ncbi:hypothetical protein RIF29_19920 [Crotalaria pallida]|uniref:VWFA domain-containing protein n=1 Tax=Crotalaria pallida TaxID=3830 RepID=A0AAN9F4I3_CROPI
MGHSTYRVPPSHYDTASSTNVPSFPSNSFQQRTSIHTDYDNGINTEPSSSVLYVNKVSAALSSAGLVYSNLIIGIDFTKSNEWTGKKSFNQRSLHHIGSGHNPYEQAISIIGKTLSSLNVDNSIPCFGFGDASTHDEDVFSFLSNERFCNGLEALSRYREIVPCLRLFGPTSFAPIIEMAMTIVERSGGKFYVLIIIADGQVTRAVDTPHGQLSPQERKTIDAIVKASEYPMSIVLVGVGDGPWDMMMKLDDKFPARAFDNFQFVNFTKIMSKSEDSTYVWREKHFRKLSSFKGMVINSLHFSVFTWRKNLEGA